MLGGSTVWEGLVAVGLAGRPGRAVGPEGRAGSSDWVLGAGSLPPTGKAALQPPARAPLTLLRGGPRCPACPPIYPEPWVCRESGPVGSWQARAAAALRVDRGQCRGQRASFSRLFGDKTDLVILPSSTGHLAEDTADAVSDPGQVWRRD